MQAPPVVHAVQASLHPTARCSARASAAPCHSAAEPRRSRCAVMHPWPDEHARQQANVARCTAAAQHAGHARRQRPTPVTAPTPTGPPPHSPGRGRPAKCTPRTANYTRHWKQAGTGDGTRAAGATSPPRPWWAARPPRRWRTGSRPSARSCCRCRRAPPPGPPRPLAARTWLCTLRAHARIHAHAEHTQDSGDSTLPLAVESARTLAFTRTQSMPAAAFPGSNRCPLGLTSAARMNRYASAKRC